MLLCKLHMKQRLKQSIDVYNELEEGGRWFKDPIIPFTTAGCMGEQQALGSKGNFLFLTAFLLFCNIYSSYHSLILFMTTLPPLFHVQVACAFCGAQVKELASSIDRACCLQHAFSLQQRHC